MSIYVSKEEQKKLVSSEKLPQGIYTGIITNTALINHKDNPSIQNVAVSVRITNMKNTAFENKDIEIKYTIKYPGKEKYATFQLSSWLRFIDKFNLSWQDTDDMYDTFKALTKKEVEIIVRQNKDENDPSIVYTNYWLYKYGEIPKKTKDEFLKENAKQQTPQEIVNSVSNPQKYMQPTPPYQNNATWEFDMSNIRTLDEEEPVIDLSKMK